MSDTNRDAIATIRGYIYQFDATILKILNAKDSDRIVIEGIEDFDTLGSDFSNYCQCKYYSSKKLSPKGIRDALLPMLEHFKAKTPNERSTSKYRIYGYFKESYPSCSTFTVQQLQESLIKQERSKNGEPKKIDYQIELGLSDDDLRQFSQVLTI